MEEWLVIGISGVTCSGKTTLAQNLYNYFDDNKGKELKPGVVMNSAHLIKQDDYFRDGDDKNHQKVEELNHKNWEIIESMDMDKMLKDVFKILNNKYILYRTKSVSNYLCRDNIFWDHYRNEFSNQEEFGMSNTKVSKPNIMLNILILEGFLIFNHAILLDLCNLKFHLHVPYEVCYERRKKRCYDPPDVPLYFEMIVWPYYEKHLREFKNREEIIFLNGVTLPEKCLDYVKNRIWTDLSSS